LTGLDIIITLTEGLRVGTSLIWERTNGFDFLEASYRYDQNVVGTEKNKKETNSI
jgi:hypothetical protein